MSVVIKVEDLSKQYRLGSVGTGSLAHDLNRGWQRLRGKEDPYLKIGEVNDRAVKGSSEYVWALKDINFDVKHGEVLGIIGRNGAGKSTLLKILSRTTSPTTGRVKIKGRVASLLEVGTGFHPELSGRENIFLNGAILGMSKGEIKKKFDEIVDFAGVERYIDTPVKRYSSGMYVRLAFGVAAHLEPEILIVDEVLAVGDAEFQKKALGKMKDVSNNQGRTVLFVSHNMTAMNTLCNKIIYMKNGLVESIGETGDIVNQYLKSSDENVAGKKWDLATAPGDDVGKLLEVKLLDEKNEPAQALQFEKGGFIEYTYQILQNGHHPVPNVHLFDLHGEHIFVSTANHKECYNTIGIYRAKAKLPYHLLNDGTYLVAVALSTLLPMKVHFEQRGALKFDVIENMDMRNTEYRGVMPGPVRPLIDWEIYEI